MTSICAIYVTYNPDIELLKRSIEITLKQVDFLYIIDNGSKVSLAGLISDFTLSRTEIVELNSNKGIAQAQNIGICKAIDDSYSDFIFFDQDSLPTKTLVSDLLSSRVSACKAGIKVAAVGPVYIDRKSLQEGVFIRTEGWSLIKQAPRSLRTSGESFLECDFLISSGCLFSKEALDVIGSMEEALFIDCVDIEWGFRALSKGFRCIAAINAKMYHTVGEAPLRLFGRDFTTHSPLRHYYYYRNLYQILKRSYVPFSWKKYVLMKSTIQAVVFSLFLSPRLKHMKFIGKGIFHGITNKIGRYE